MRLYPNPDPCNPPRSTAVSLAQHPRLEGQAQAPREGQPAPDRGRPSQSRPSVICSNPHHQLPPSVLPSFLLGSMPPPPVSATAASLPHHTRIPPPGAHYPADSDVADGDVDFLPLWFYRRMSPTPAETSSRTTTSSESCSWAFSKKGSKSRRRSRKRPSRSPSPAGTSSYVLLLACFKSTPSQEFSLSWLGRTLRLRWF